MTAWADWLAWMTLICEIVDAGALAILSLFVSFFFFPFLILIFDCQPQHSWGKTLVVMIKILIASINLLQSALFSLVRIPLESFLFQMVALEWQHEPVA